jgi:hypothetical protein
MSKDYRTLISCKLNVAEIKEINYSYKSAERQGFDINVTMEPWRVKELIFQIWNKFPDEFEEVLKEENFVEVKK